MTGGSRANKNGYDAEESVALIFENLGAKYQRQAPFRKAYGPRDGKSDGVAHFSKDRKIRIEVKTQKVSGSVSEKMPNMLFHAYNHYEETEIIFVILGDGWSKGSIEWFRKMCNPRNWSSYCQHQSVPPKWSDKEIKVFTSYVELKNYIGELNEKLR